MAEEKISKEPQSLHIAKLLSINPHQINSCLQYNYFVDTCILKKDGQDLLKMGQFKRQTNPINSTS